MGNLGMAAGQKMDLVTISSNLGEYRNSSKSPSSVASKALNQLEQQQSQKTVSLVQKSAPLVGNGNGKLVNLLA
jgi:hypothetical protein